MIEVAAAIIKDGEKFLLCQRSKDDSCPLQWEFPGGKKEPGETIERCIIREIKEELDVEIEIVSVYKQTLYHVNDLVVPFTFFNCDIVSGEIQLNVHEKLVWATKDSFSDFDFMPADIEIVQSLMHEH